MAGSSGEHFQVEQSQQWHYEQQVEELFDDYADTFEESLVEGLGYDVPALVESELRPPGRGALSSRLAIDLGCGTGLAGCRLRKHITGQLVGCDLSSGMLDDAAVRETECRSGDDVASREGCALLYSSRFRGRSVSSHRLAARCAPPSPTPRQTALAARKRGTSWEHRSSRQAPGQV